MTCSQPSSDIAYPKTEMQREEPVGVGRPPTVAAMKPKFDATTSLGPGSCRRYS